MKSLRKFFVIVLTSALLLSGSMCMSFAGKIDPLACCDKFSWSNCRGVFDGHTKYVYCNNCGALVLTQANFTACNSNSVRKSGRTTYYYCSICGKYQGSYTEPVCSLSGYCNNFSWSRCYGVMSGHTKYCYCNSCDGLVLVQENFTECDRANEKIVGDTKYFYCSVCGKNTGSEIIETTPSAGGTQSGGAGSSQNSEDSGDNNHDGEIGDSVRNGGGSFSYSYSGNVANCKYDIEMWHYSGGYWKIGNNISNAETIDDSVLGALVLVENHLNNYCSDFEFLIPYPSGCDCTHCKVSAALQNEDAFQNLECVNEKNGVRVRGRLCFHLLHTNSMDDYVSGLKKDIPLIASKYGSNIYAMYGNKLDASEGVGRFDSANIITSPYIHPLEIKDNSGALKNGYSVFVADAIKSSDGFRIGKNTFSNAGAIGLRFSFPFSISFTKINESADDDNGGAGGNSGSPEITPTKPNDDTGSSAGGGNTDSGKPGDNDIGGSESGDTGGNPEESTTPGSTRDSGGLIHRKW